MSAPETRINAVGFSVVDVVCDKDPEHKGEVLYDDWARDGGAECNPDCGGKMVPA